MSIKVEKINHEQVVEILSSEESHFLDLKSINIKPAKLTRSISAFANASGGEVYIGIDETKIDGKNQRIWRGFADQEDANAHLQVFQELFPLGQYYSYTFLSCDGCIGLVLQVEINKNREIVKALDRPIPYLRLGAQNLPQDTEEKLARLKLDKGIDSFETSTVKADMEVITNSLPILNFMLRVIPSAEPEQWLKKQQLIINGKPTVGGVLLFSEEPQALLPKRCGVKVYRYKTADEEGRRENLAFDPITIEGCLYDQIIEAVNKTKNIVEEIPKLESGRLQHIEYPDEVLHEIITNAVLHRDYSILKDVQIRIFDNRVEVESPGRLPGHITIENILKEQFARNGVIVRLINRFPEAPNKDVGEGLNTAFEAMTRLRLKVPVIAEQENSVIVYIRHEPLASIESAIMEYLNDHENITNKIARRIASVDSESTIKAAFNRLREQGLIEIVPGTKTATSAWRKLR
ncbi:putative DNA binding domain-containing protein [Nostoc edaphicum CCNP1411]|uniref:Putative DNA binding domain-containing protein n=1 Tax=Nostoc edaphicum CCNP1411 TaxID=1472755 RepID=A0A7D7QKT5_9NOSO|nr:ATP-binding protein [Nostoc edaphicum]QMS89404.1 putative DNA binding domain-containing protein [Nostoc edaphicum CCNP1411]